MVGTRLPLPRPPALADSKHHRDNAVLSALALMLMFPAMAPSGAICVMDAWHFCTSAFQRRLQACALTFADSKTSQLSIKIPDGWGFEDQ
jgi:hypothetical protein